MAGDPGVPLGAQILHNAVIEPSLEKHGRYIMFMAGSRENTLGRELFISCKTLSCICVPSSFSVPPAPIP